MATIIGTGLNDVLAGTVDADLIEGGAGNDRINGGAGDDEIFGGIGSDILTGDAGNDRIFGEDGNDGVYGGGGNDTIDGGVGDDILIGDGGNDEILGGAGHDKLYGGTGNDRLDGGSGDDLVYGEAGDDILVYRSGDGNDTFFGGIGNDRLELQLNGSDITAALRADLAAYQTWAANQAAAAGTSTALAGQATGDTFAFASLGISISVVEGLSIVVDGQPVTMEFSLQPGANEHHSVQCEHCRRCGSWNGGWSPVRHRSRCRAVRDLELCFGGSLKCVRDRRQPARREAGRGTRFRSATDS